jgi:glutamate/aspartate transport system permease protein
MAEFDLAYLMSALPLLWDGMEVTLLLTLFGVIGGLALGAVLAVLRLSRAKPLALLAAGYVTFFRSIPIRSASSGSISSCRSGSAARSAASTRR